MIFKNNFQKANKNPKKLGQVEVSVNKGLALKARAPEFNQQNLHMLRLVTHTWHRCTMEEDARGICICWPAQPPSLRSKFLVNERSCLKNKQLKVHGALRNSTLLSSGLTQTSATHTLPSHRLNPAPGSLFNVKLVISKPIRLNEIENPNMYKYTIIQLLRIRKLK